MKKIIAIFIAAVMLFTVFTACSGDVVKKTNSKLSVVCTIFPEYDWVMEILGDRADDVDVTLLLDNGVDLHNYQPTAEDIVKISSCDMFIYVGGESDKWVDDVLKNAQNPDMIALNLIDILGANAKEERVIEGMQVEEERENEEEHAQETEGKAEYDEHVWLSLINARLFCTRISEELAKLDSENAQTYIDNGGAYVDKLNELHNQFQQEIMETGNINPVLLFADRFPFMYLTDDYGITYYAAFVGCSAETEASFETVKFLVEKVDEFSLKYIMIIDGSTDELAKTVISNTKDKNQQILVLNSMQTVTSADRESGSTYYSIMQSNLEVLKTALS